MTKPKVVTGTPENTRVYTQGKVRAIVVVDGFVGTTTLTGYTLDSFRARCSIQVQQPDGTWR